MLAEFYAYEFLKVIDRESQHIIRAMLCCHSGRYWIGAAITVIKCGLMQNCIEHIVNKTVDGITKYILVNKLRHNVIIISCVPQDRQPVNGWKGSKNDMWLFTDILCLVTNSTDLHMFFYLFLTYCSSSRLLCFFATYPSAYFFLVRVKMT